jgi:hypothetical protein
VGFIGYTRTNFTTSWCTPSGFSLFGPDNWYCIREDAHSWLSCSFSQGRTSSHEYGLETSRPSRPSMGMFSRARAGRRHMSCRCVRSAHQRLNNRTVHLDSNTSHQNRHEGESTSIMRRREPRYVTSGGRGTNICLDTQASSHHSGHGTYNATRASAFCTWNSTF